MIEDTPTQCQYFYLIKLLLHTLSPIEYRDLLLLRNGFCVARSVSFQSGIR